jgi:hypothetical protein
VFNIAIRVTRRPQNARTFRLYVDSLC